MSPRRPTDPRAPRPPWWQARGATAARSLQLSGLFGLLGTVALVGGLQVEPAWFLLAALGFFLNGLLFALGGRAQLGEERAGRRRDAQGPGEQPYLVAAGATGLGAVLAGLAALARALA
ncbi:hypothetical protein [Vallicoccus soli]|uniref:Uncharacterized protein n=1 Tax=Vallicoccus soli TaxID=2339232 RepID=A0A3A3YQE7_9ACTN|nr:hypothetical protein [Vallicoccus soli]RJK92925.1 hypothetical protein D5H78_17545 [Vallicoccus soli]